MYPNIQDFNLIRGLCTLHKAGTVFEKLQKNQSNLILLGIAGLSPCTIDRRGRSTVDLAVKRSCGSKEYERCYSWQDQCVKKLTDLRGRTFHG